MSVDHPIPDKDEIALAMHTLDMLIVAAEDARLPDMRSGADAFVSRLADAYEELDELIKVLT